MKMLLPLYIHPLIAPSAWRAAASLDATVIVNVHNGPGETVEAAYEEVTAMLCDADVSMLGYVDLDYGCRPPWLIERDISRWRRYPVEGIFFDQVPTSAERLSYVAVLARQARGMTVLNPGTRPHADYAQLAEIVCTFEGAWSDYRPSSDWPNAAHLVHSVPVSELDIALAAVTTDYGLVTDLAMPLPYLGLPCAYSSVS